MSWVIKALAPAKFQIIKKTTDTFFRINGSRAGPGTYSVQKGSSVDFRVTVQNVGESAGEYWVAVYDKKSKQYIWYRTGYLSPGNWAFVESSIKVDRDMELMFATGRGTQVGQNTTDTWGC